MVTADSITDEQIHGLRLDLARALNDEGDLPYSVWKPLLDDFTACEAALGRIRKRFQRPGMKAAARARCAEILNARAKESKQP